ncbi:helix-turn-helix domain-containing protein [Spongiibacter thalassae]|uniref:helix-turn-helix domain-containing protein n=1 Tax=Spongiibacter thalassae TaxID=2721624 RepID=UPI003D0F41BF
MIRCHLARIMGEHKLRIADVARETGLSRATITLLYKETAQKVDLEAIEKLCLLFECQVGDLLNIAREANINDMPAKAIADTGTPYNRVPVRKLSAYLGSFASGNFCAALSKV